MKILTRQDCNRIGEGVIEYSCKHCDEKLIKATSATGHTPGAAATCTQPQVCEKCGTVLEVPKGHHYSKTVSEPTCTDIGYTTYICDDCKDTFIADYTDKLPHDYHTEITNPTCTEMGYTTYTCECCGDSYKADYTDKAEHSYSKDVTEPTCTAMGYTTFICDDCGDTHKGEYKDALGHTPSAWIIDTAATIENAGEKHIECLICGEVLQTVDIPQLIDKDNSDEDGKSQIGNYSIILTDKNGKPIFNREITIDVNDKISIKLPENRLLDYADQTTITVFKTDTQEAVSGLNIFIEDKNSNNATGITNTDGQLKVPNDKSSTGDNNGTIGGGDEDNKFTYVVSVKNKENIITDNCDIWIGESNNIVVDLPDGVKPTKDEPVIVTVVDQNGTAQADVTVVVLGDADFIEKGKTDIYGKVTLPITNEGYTDEDGKVNVDTLNVIVNDETEVIANAFVVHNEDGTITVTLPDEKSISYDNRITVTVLDSEGTPVSGTSVTVNDVDEKTFTASTDENGKITVPPISDDYTDNDGKAVVNGLNVLVTDETKPIENAFVTIVDGKISVILPDTNTLTTSNQTTVTVMDKDSKPVSNVSVTVNDKNKATATQSTNTSGQITVPVKASSGGSSGGSSSSGGGGGSYSSASTVNVKVVDKDGKTVSVTKSTDSKGNITATLPTGKVINEDNYYTITVTDGKGNAKADTSVTLKDKKNGTVTGTTDKKGVLTLPASEHKAYVFGYPDGTFKSDGDMTRAEASAIFARLISEEKDEKISGTKTSFTDVSKNEWYFSYIAYLEKYNIIKGYEDDTFRPNAPVTRAEFVAMTVRYYSLFNEVKTSGYTVKYNDVNSSYWAYNDVAYAKNIGWLNGYADCTFKGDNNITRAEVVTVVNNATGRTADESYVDKNYSNLEKFTDLKNNSHWAFYDIMEAANEHKAVIGTDGETWIK